MCMAICFKPYLRTALAVMGFTGLLLGFVQAAMAVTPDSPEVKAVLDKAFKYLETASDNRLGGKCLIGLCFVKRGETEAHAQVQAAVAACQAAVAGKQPGQPINDDVYSNGLA